MTQPIRRATTRSTDNASQAFSWFSNPLDWRPIDRLILLGALVMIAPALFGGSLLATLYLAPNYLQPAFIDPLLGFYAVHALLLSGFLGHALRRRHVHNDWPALENFVIGSFVVNVLVSGYLTGTHFTEGLLLIFLGINITAALANMHKIRIAYFFVCFVMLIFAIIDFTGAFKYAPLFARFPINADGSMAAGWLAIRIEIAFTLIAISLISMAAVQRWVVRENLYKEMSTIDGLTRLTNRRCFIERGHRELSRARRISSGGVSCIMIDLDHFKNINDTWGHHAGDQVLVAAANILLANARQHDEVGRYGGEEFALLLPGTPEAAAVKLAERIREKIASTTVEVDGHSISMSASFGVAYYPAECVDGLNDLLKIADKALYAAKDAGRNRVMAASQPFAKTA